MSTSQRKSSERTKRGKLLPAKRLYQISKGQANSPDSNENSSDTKRIEDSGDVDLTLDEKSRRARLLQQRHPPSLELGQLPDDILFRITGFLDIRSLLEMRCLSRKHQWLCSRNEAGWAHLTSQLWSDKIHISEKARVLSRDKSNDCSMMAAYRESITDARDRQFLSTQELCYDPSMRQGTVWSFRFKESAGSDWTATDPWYQGESCRKLVFLPDGSMKQYVTGTARLESPRFSANGANGSANDSRLPNQNVNHNNDQGENADNNNPQLDHMVVDPPITMSWRLITSPMDLPTRPLGSYVRITVGGRDVPTYSVRRSPTQNWGFIMESCWGLIASFELPARLPERERNGTPRPSRHPRRILRRTAQGNVWVNVPAHYVEEDDAHDVDESTMEDGRLRIHDEDPMRPLRDDSYLIVTNEVQWREAFLYNVGAHLLPEGEDATDEFDRAWGNQ